MKRKYQKINVVTLSLLIFILLCSFLPISPSWKYMGKDPYNGKAVYSVKFNHFFLCLNDLFTAGDAFSIVVAVSIILFYLLLLVCIISVLLKKDYITLYSLCFIIICNIIGTISLSAISFFSTISLLLCMSLFITNIIYNKSILDSFRNREEKQKKKKMIQIGNNIKRERKNKGMTQEDLGKTIFVSRTMIAKFESGVCLPSEEQIDLIANALEIDKTSLLLTKNVNN